MKGGGLNLISGILLPMEFFQRFKDGCNPLTGKLLISGARRVSVSWRSYHRAVLFLDCLGTLYELGSVDNSLLISLRIANV